MNTDPVELQTIALTLTPESSQLHGYRYDAATRTLTVEFASNHDTVSYRYLNVPPNVAAGLDAAKSKGAYVYQSIKAQYDFERQDKPRKEVAQA